jgi:HK97 gp10 family phage protein
VQVKWRDDELLKLIQENADEALFTAGEILIGAATANAPEDSGDLKASGYVATKQRSTYEPDNKSNRQIKPRNNEAVVGFASFYAKFLERGTSRMAARPFMRPALDSSKDTLAKAIVNRLRKGIE